MSVSEESRDFALRVNLSHNILDFKPYANFIYAEIVGCEF